MNAVASLFAKPTIELMERGLVPEFLMRQGIRRLLRLRLMNLSRSLSESGLEVDAFNEKFINEAWNSPLAIATDAANQQHYEIPASFYDLVLGPHKKYSCCYFEPGDEGCQISLQSAESKALEITCQRAGLVDGQTILELGCGWGSLTLWMAQRFPNSFITAISNSNSQRQYILDQARKRGIADRLNVVTCDINEFESQQKFDRIVSVEMFEHVRNHRMLLNRVANWLADDGQLFVHIFCHRDFVYPFETEGSTNWMGRYFFTGGLMPNQKLLALAAEKLKCQQTWIWDGKHYEQTSNLWAANMDQNKTLLVEILNQIYGAGNGFRWFYRWKLFFLACAELFGTDNGNEWFVQHSLFSK